MSNLKYYRRLSLKKPKETSAKISFWVRLNPRHPEYEAGTLRVRLSQT